jgi:hypothetical protein
MPNSGAKRLIMVSSTCFEHPIFHPQKDLYMQFYCISLMHPYKRPGRDQTHPDIDYTAYMDA